MSAIDKFDCSNHENIFFYIKLEVIVIFFVDYEHILLNVHERVLISLTTFLQPGAKYLKMRTSLQPKHMSTDKASRSKIFDRELERFLDSVLDKEQVLRNCHFHTFVLNQTQRNNVMFRVLTSAESLNIKTQIMSTNSVLRCSCSSRFKKIKGNYLERRYRGGESVNINNVFNLVQFLKGLFRTL